MPPAVLLALALATQDPIPVSAPDRAAPVRFEEVADVLAAKCLGCHNAGLAEGKLVLEDVPSMLRGGGRGPAVVPGQADASLLLRLASHRDDPHMPPADRPGTAPLTPDELGLLRLWIDAGAPDDSGEPVAPRPVPLGALPPGVRPILAVDLTADGRRVAAGRANLVQVYDTASGLQIASLAGHRDLIQSLRFSADGAKLAAGSYQVVTLWNCPTGGESRTFSGHSDAVAAVAATPDGQALLSAGADATLRAWGVADGKEALRIDLPAPALSVACAPDGARVAAGCRDGSIRLHTLPDGAPAADWKLHGLPVHALAFCGPDRLAAAFEGGLVMIFDVPESPDAAATPPAVLSAGAGTVRALASTPDGRLLATAGDDATPRLWSVPDARLLRALPPRPAPVLAVALSPSGDALLTGSADADARLQRLDDPDAPPLVLSAHRGPVRAVALSPDGSRALTAGDEGGLMVWESSDGRKVIAFGHDGPKDAKALPPVRAVAFLSNAAFASASDAHTLKTWTFDGSWAEWATLGPHADRVLALDFNPDASLLAAGSGEPSRSGELTVWETGKGLLVRRLDHLHSDTILALRFRPDGARLATASADRLVKLLDVPTGRELATLEGHDGHVLALDWNADGTQLVSGGSDRVLKFWNAEAGESLRTSSPLPAPVTALRWSRTGRNPAVAASTSSSTAHLVNPASGLSTRTFSSPSPHLSSLSLTPDRSLLAAGGSDGSLLLWDGESGQEARKLEP